MISQVISSLGPTLLYACTQVETKKGSGEKGNIPNRRLVIFDARSFAHFMMPVVRLMGYAWAAAACWLPMFSCVWL